MTGFAGRGALSQVTTPSAGVNRSYYTYGGRRGMQEGGLALPRPDWATEEVWQRALERAAKESESDVPPSGISPGIRSNWGRSSAEDRLSRLTNFYAAQETPGPQFGNGELARTVVLGGMLGAGLGSAGLLGGGGGATGAGAGTAAGGASGTLAPISAAELAAAVPSAYSGPLASLAGAGTAAGGVGGGALGSVGGSGAGSIVSPGVAGGGGTLGTVTLPNVAEIAPSMVEAGGMTGAGAGGPLSRMWGNVKDYFAPGGKKDWSRIIGAGGSAVGALGALSGVGSGGGQPIPLPDRFNEPLPQLNMRRIQNPSQPDYYNYGQTGGEHQFFVDNAIPEFASADSAAPGLEVRDPRVGVTGGVAMRAHGGSAPGNGEFMTSRGQNFVRGSGSGRDDAIPAQLSDSEYVMDAESVALLGDGSSEEGARRLDEMRKRLRRHKGRGLASGKFSAAAKSPEEYMRGGRMKKAKGGRVSSAVSSLDDLADKFEAALGRGDRRTVGSVGAEMDKLHPGASGAGREAFAKGGGVARAIKKFLERRSSADRREVPREDRADRRYPNKRMDMAEIADTLRRINPESDILRQYEFERMKHELGRGLEDEE